MKRSAAILLTGCLTLQSLSGSVLAAQEPVFLVETEMVVSTEAPAAVSEPVVTSEAVVETPVTESVAETLPPAETSTEAAVSESAAETQAAATVSTEEFSTDMSVTEPSTGETAAEPVSETAGEPVSETASEAMSEIAGTEELTVQPAEDELIFGELVELESESELESDSEIDLTGGVMTIAADTGWADKSYVEVKVVATQEFSPAKEVTVSIAGGATQTIPRTLSLPGLGSASTKFEVLPGEYTVQIQAEKFAQYTQTVRVDSSSTAKIEVCTSKYEREGTNAKRGWLRLGDVTGDSMIDNSDIEQLLSDIRMSPTNSKSNLNDWKGAKVDLADLQYAVQSIDASQEATVETLFVPSGLIQDETTQGTTVEGADRIFSDEGLTTLTPAKSGEPISTENPVAVGFAFGKEEATYAELPKMEGITIQAPDEENVKSADNNNITSGTVSVTYLDESGNEQIMDIAISNKDSVAEAAMIIGLDIMPVAEVKTDAATVEPDGSLVLNFGSKIAVKRVTIKITGTKKSEPLVNIAKVEFVNDMASRIPAPELSIPEIQSIVPANEEFTVIWNAQNNVTGYELWVEGPTKKSNGEKRNQVVRISGTSHTVVSVNDESLMNFAGYTVKVRSVNGEWTSGWSNEVQAVPSPTSTPDYVDNLVTTGGFRSIHATWKDMDDADGYMLYYCEEGSTEYQPVVPGYTLPENGEGRLTANSYTISGLKDGTTYKVYVVGWNGLGWGKTLASENDDKPIRSVVTTESGETPKLPLYRLINTSNGTGVLSAHIVNAFCGTHGGQKMMSSPLDEAQGDTRPTVNGEVRKDARWAYGVADDDYTSYWIKNDWDDGVAYPVNDFSKGVTVTFDAEYKMNYLTFTATDITANPSQARIMYWNSQTGAEGAYIGSTLTQEIDATNRPYFVVRFDKAVTANQIQMCIGTGSARIDLKVAEMHFHSYDPLDDDILALFADEMHTSLKEGVTQETIDALRARLNVADPVSGELHPLYKTLELELKAAEELLTWGAGETIAVDNRITAKKDGHINFGGLNAWQPLGRVAAAGDKLIIYVGHNAKTTGDASNLKLYFTQYHAESNSLTDGHYSLKVGRNEIVLKGPSSNNFERGGQLYVAYEGNNASDQYGIRINGGQTIPVLNVYKKTGEERTAAIKQYLFDLETYVGTIQEKHTAEHQNSSNKNVQYAYDEQNCFLNATDLMMDHMMYSFPATQVWKSLSDKADKVAALDIALQAMDQTMTLFYQHKGLNAANSGNGGKNLMPSRHLNIRYMRMFSGAFMYASGNHIGVEYGQTTLCGASSWNSFGWGIAHEIGHDINDPAYAIAEITNNYFAQLLTMETSGQRWGKDGDYTKVYEKVTSGAVGRSANVGTQLALYWQLHLAFDDYPDKTIFEDYKEQFDNLFFARVDTYSRNPGLAKKDNIELKLDGGVDQNLMRLACAAANANILPFFERWGMEPDEATTKYAEAYGTATAKALYYVNDTARDYRAAHKNEDTNSFEVNVTASAAAENNRVTLTMGSDKPDLTLGYEIVRGMYSDGELKKEVVGFVAANGDGSAVYTDAISAVDNRVMYYEVKAVDKFLNYAAKTVEAGAKKISTGGAYGKDLWTAETTMTSSDDSEVVWNDNNPDGGYDKDSGAGEKQSAIGRVIDNQTSSVYHGTSKGNETIIIDLQKNHSITSVRYLGSDVKLSIAVSQDKSNWTAVKTNYAVSDCASNAATIWFDAVHESDGKSEKLAGTYGTYDARYVRFKIETEGEVAISEIDICGPSGDNVEFYSAGSSLPAIGKTTADYQYGDKAEDVIPKGSLLFTGNYKGNPAYNVVVLYDQDGNVIGAKGDAVNSVQVIFADVPAQGELGETTNGTWVYFVKPGDWDETTLAAIKQVRAELLRVDNALTLDGERIVSDTVFVDMPGTLPDITLTADNVKKQQ